MPEAKKVVRTVLLPVLQLILGLFLILKTTPLWAVIHCAIAYFLDCCHFPYTDYKQLRKFSGRVFKKVILHATAAGDVPKVKKQKDPRNLREMIAESENRRLVSVDYLGQSFVLERMDGKMQVRIRVKQKNAEKAGMKDGPAYYITDKMRENIKYIEKVAAETVFVKNQKEVWEEVVTGDIMEFEEVLDSVILDNRAVVRLDHDYFLPVNLLLAEDKLRSTLNFVGIFLQTQKQVHWIISACLSLTSVVIGFSTTLRLSVACWIGKIICRGVQFLCDLLPYTARRSIYAWGSWVEGFKPSNDIEAKIVKRDVELLVAGGAKFHSESKIKRVSVPDCLPLVDKLCSGGGPFLLRCDPNCISNSDLNSDTVFVEWVFQNGKCTLKAGRIASNKMMSSLQEDETSIVCGVEGVKALKFLKVNKSSMANDSHTASVQIDFFKADRSLMADGIHTASVDIDCSTDEEAIKLFIFAAHMAEVKSGSLKSYDSKTRSVYVRRFVESINAYVRSGYPPLHKLELKNVVVR